MVRWVAVGVDGVAPQGVPSPLTVVADAVSATSNTTAGSGAGKAGLAVAVLAVLGGVLAVGV